MPAFSVRDLRSQFDRVKRLGWLPAVEAAARAHGHEPWDLLAIGSRESNLDPKYLRITGDHGNGFGPWQVDKRYFPEWTRSGKWRDAQEAAEKGAEVLAAKRQEILDSRGKQRTVTSRSGQRATFTGGAFTTSELRLIAFAAYNSGLWAYYHHTKAGDPDRGTTGKDYSRDVDARSRVFRQLWRVWETDGASDLAASPPAGIVSGGETAPSPDTAVPPGEGAPVSDSSVTAEAGSMVQISQPAAEVASAPVEGGGPDDPAKKANETSLVKKITGWVGRALAGIGITGAITGGATLVSSAGTLAEQAQIILILMIGGMVCLAIIVFGVMAIYVAWRDHAQTKDLRADVTKVNVK
jgi:hypothetical protein